MSHGKKVCKILKEIRQQIAEKNDIELVISECHFQGECKGTCPKCEAEVRYLEKELNKRRQLGKAVAIAGISLGVAGTFAECGTPKQDNTQTPEQKLLTETVNLDTIPITPVDSFKNEKERPKWEIFQTQGIINVKDCYDINNEFNSEYFEQLLKENELLNEDRIIENIIGINGDVPPPVGQMEVMPEYPGGNEEIYKFLKENLVYPKEAQENGIEGVVLLEFVIEKDGSISNVKIIHDTDIGYGCGEEAVRVMKMLPEKWKTSAIYGVNRRIYYQIPVQFTLEKE